MKIGLISDKTNKKTIKLLKKHINKNNHEAILLNTSSDLINNCENLKREFNNKSIDRGIVVDEYGILSFMYLAKTKNIVVAEISDEHSAYMTCAHNNASILTFSSSISTIHMMKCMVDSFLSSNYEGGRHKVRIDMLSTMLNQE